MNNDANIKTTVKLAGRTEGDWAALGRGETNRSMARAVGRSSWREIRSAVRFALKG